MEHGADGAEWCGVFWRPGWLRRLRLVWRDDVAHPAGAIETAAVGEAAVGDADGAAGEREQRPAIPKGGRVSKVTAVGGDGGAVYSQHAASLHRSAAQQGQAPQPERRPERDQEMAPRGSGVEDAEARRGLALRGAGVGGGAGTAGDVKGAAGPGQQKRQAAI